MTEKYGSLDDVGVWLEWPEIGAGGAQRWAELPPCVGHSRGTASSTFICWSSGSLIGSLEAEALGCWG